MFCTFSMLSATVATSDRRIVRPCLVATATPAKSAALSRLAFIWTVSVWRRLSSCPMGVLEFALCSAAAISSSVRSTATSLAGSAWMRTA